MAAVTVDIDLPPDVRARVGEHLMNVAPGTTSVEQANEFPPGAAKVLALLLEARAYAEQLQRPVWDFAVEVEWLWRTGVNNSLLRWLLCQGYAQHGTESSRGRLGERRIRPLAGLTLPSKACFILTPAGVAAARKVALEPGPLSPAGAREQPAGGCAAGSWVPRWDMGRRELHCGSILVKRFRRPAPNQERILCAFEEEGWPSHIDDPLPILPERAPQERLHDTINHLNRNQKHDVLRFRSNGHGSGVCWELVVAKLTTLAPDRHQMGS
jgi:hypothetical protein